MVRERNFPNDLRRGLGTVSNFPRWYITGSTLTLSLTLCSTSRASFKFDHRRKQSRSPSRKSHLRLFDFNLPLSRPGQSASLSEDLLGPARFSHYPKSLSYLIWIRAFTLRSSACRSKVIGEAAGGKYLFITPLSPEPPGNNLGLQSADECLPSYPFPIVWV
ncbi:unnamed protein product [Vicia faba]|uniref:Uncharacterized protein n=1 Tax=Vicia faba TaxID=3906 RepID=A0AAV1AB23_VICFA|nr:unnamed protein product [Vicia faba]